MHASIQELEDPDKVYYPEAVHELASQLGIVSRCVKPFDITIILLQEKVTWFRVVSLIVTKVFVPHSRLNALDFLTMQAKSIAVQNHPYKLMIMWILKQMQRIIMVGYPLSLISLQS